MVTTSPTPVFLFAAMALVTMTSSSRVLMIPAPIYNNVNNFAVAAETLKDDGHDVTVLIHDFYATRFDRANVKALMYSLPEKAIALNTLIQEMAKTDKNMLQKVYNFYNILTTAIHDFCHALLGNDQIMNAIRDASYDLAMIDSVPVFACLHYVPYKYDIPRINLGPYQAPWTYGVSSVPFNEPPPFIEMSTTPPSLTKRVKSLLIMLLFESLPMILGFTKHAKAFLPEKPLKSGLELMNESEMTLITVEINCFDFPKISAPHYKFIGSLTGSNKPEVLPDEYKKFADAANDGLIIISFGSVAPLRKTIVNQMPMLIEALGRMKENVVLQFTLADLADLKIPPNIFLTEWLPQTSLLAHQNTKLFVSHGGLNGHLEATYCGVPILTLPYHFEQARNGARAEMKGHGKHLKWDETNAEELYSTMREIIDDKSYKQNIMKCREIIKDIPSATEQLSFWVNHILKHGSEHLRPISADMSFYQFFGLDVFAILGFALLIAFVLVYGCFRCCFMCCCCSSKIKKD